MEDSNHSINYVDWEGKPYKAGHSWPEGGGLDSRCSHNREAYDAFEENLGWTALCDALENQGWWLVSYSRRTMSMRRDDTLVFFEGSLGEAAYMHTVYVEPMSHKYAFVRNGARVWWEDPEGETSGWYEVTLDKPLEELETKGELQEDTILTISNGTSEAEVWLCELHEMKPQNTKANQADS